jgi:hypothetical protein
MNVLVLIKIRSGIGVFINDIFQNDPNRIGIAK